MSKHVCYEFDMLVQVGTKLIDRGLAADPVDQYARVESFLLHLRQIYDFLYRDWTPFDNAALAVDYDSEWPKKRDPPSQSLQDQARDVSLYAAHLTVERIKEKGHQVSDPGRELLRAIRKFLDPVPTLFIAKPSTDLKPRWAQEMAGPFVISTSVSVGNVFLPAIDRPKKSSD